MRDHSCGYLSSRNSLESTSFASGAHHHTCLSDPSPKTDPIHPKWRDGFVNVYDWARGHYGTSIWTTIYESTTAKSQTLCFFGSVKERYTRVRLTETSFSLARDTFPVITTRLQLFHDHNIFVFPVSFFIQGKLFRQSLPTTFSFFLG